MNPMYPRIRRELLDFEVSYAHDLIKMGRYVPAQSRMAMDLQDARLRITELEKELNFLLKKE